LKIFPKSEVQKLKMFFFFTTIILLTILIIFYVILYKFPNLLDNDINDILKAILLNLIAAIFTSIIIGLLIFFLLPSEKKMLSVEIVEPNRTKNLHDWALKNTDFWYHFGHTARWVRVTVMPYLSNISIEKGIKTVVKIIIINPLNYDLCRQYSNYRNRISFKEKGDNKSVESISADIYATILKSQYYNQNNCGLEVKVFFTNHFTIYREDLSRKVVFRTQPDPRAPCLMFKDLDQEIDKSEFYHGSKSDFQQQIEMCNEFIFDKNINLEFPLKKENVKSYFSKIGVPLSNSIDISLIIDRFNSDYHPYN
jgi:hypothetical protein